ncbi:MAG: hypothetical protein CMJ54_04105 [Planctomycetaceae bacterium]|nr:hypothetical protein [Planctomycetaceae bacterium]
MWVVQGPSRRLCSIRGRLRPKLTVPGRFSAIFCVFGRTYRWFDAIHCGAGVRPTPDPGPIRPVDP